MHEAEIEGSHEQETILVYVARSCLKIKKQEKGDKEEEKKEE